MGFVRVVHGAGVQDRMILDSLLARVLSFFSRWECPQFIGILKTTADYHTAHGSWRQSKKSLGAAFLRLISLLPQ